MHILLSLTFACGLLLVFLSLTGSLTGSGERRPAGGAGSVLARLLALVVPGGSGNGGRSDGESGNSARDHARDLAAASLAAAAVAGLVAQAFFGWAVVTVAAAGTGLLLPSWYFRQRAERHRAEVEEAVGEAIEALRDAVRIGLSIEEAIHALARTGPQALRADFRELERDLRLAGFEGALERARERVAEPLFDTLAVALLTAYRIGGRNLAAVLDGLSRSVRGSVQARREVRAQQAQNVLSARVIAALPLVLILIIRGTNPGYLEVFSSPGGQAVLALCLFSVVLGYTAMLRATALPGDGRVLR